MPNKLSQFWQEVKRRNVVRVVTVFAGAAFVILELVDIIAEPLKLPSWLLPVVIILLSVGFIIAVILSWIYDVHPEGGMVKTEPAGKVKEEDSPKSSNGWKIASYISFVVIVGLILLNIFPGKGKKEILEKSIIVLPFKSLSDDPEKQYLADGIMDAIILHLSKIEDLRVLARTTSEKYRDTDKTATEICQELGVSFALEGSFRKYSDQARLIVQLIRSGEEDHVWANPYDREWKDIFAVESEVAQAIARELQAAITPEEKQLIDKVPTTSLTAHDFYQRGKEEHWKYWTDNDNRWALERAEMQYHNALEYDSAFAEAYSGLARVYWDKYYWNTFLSGNFLDSVMILADVALSFDTKLAEAFTIKGDYFSEIGFPEQAIREYDKAIKLNPNDWMAYYGKGNLYWFKSDNVKAIDNFQKAVNLNRGSELPFLLGSLGTAYRSIGFIEISKKFNREALKLSGDSIEYYRSLSYCGIVAGNYMKGIEYAEKLQKIDSNDVANLSHIGFSLMFLGQHEEALELYKRFIEIIEIGQGVSLWDMHRIGWAYWQNGYKEEAAKYFKAQIDYCNMMNELGRGHSDSVRTAYDLAAVYAFMGEKEKAYENLRIHNQRQRYSLGHFTRIKNDPFFNSLRDETEFQRIVKEIEAKYQAEHDRVQKWLEENELL